MKKIVLIAVFVSVLNLPAISKAASVGNIADTQGKGGKISIGVEYDGIFDRDLEFKSGTTSVTMLGITESSPSVDPGESIKDMKMGSNRIFLKGTIGVHPGIDLFVKLGMADGKWEYKYVSPGFPDIKDEFDGDYGFAYGVGVKAKIFETSGGFRLLGNAQYLSYEVDGKVKENGVDIAEFFRQELAKEGITATASYNSKTKVEEWQIALYVNKTFGQFSPYGGIKYSDLRIKNETNLSGLASGIPYSVKVDQKGEADKNFGIFAGADINIIPNRLSLNIEGRFLDETAGTIGINYKF